MSKLSELGESRRSRHPIPKCQMSTSTMQLFSYAVNIVVALSQIKLVFKSSRRNGRTALPLCYELDREISPIAGGTAL